jgi:hypothetical protein
LQENVDHHDGINKGQGEEEDKEIEEISVDKEDEEATGETSKDQETMVFPPTHKLPRFLDKNQPMNHKSTLCEQ